VSSSRAHALRESPGRERVRYFSRQLITANDLTTEQEHFREKLRRHNRFLHGSGVVCGLEVTAAPTEGAPWRVRISEGYALGPHGDEIYVAEPTCVDLARCGPQADPDPCEPMMSRRRPRPTSETLFVAIRYMECPTRPVRVSPSGCGCDDALCEYSRIRDSFEIDCLTDLPVSENSQSLCALVSSKKIPPCPPCPDEPWVVLARVLLPESARKALEAGAIDNWSDRKMLFGTATLQQQVIECCCDVTVAPATVVRITPSHNSRYAAGSAKPKGVSITFSKALKKETVTDKAIVVFLSTDNGATSAPVPGTVTYDSGTGTAVFTPDEEFPASDGGFDYIYTVMVRGDEPNAIRDADGLALDGDKDATAGGNFTSTFRLTLSA
jgi:hypothetical protein